MGSSDNFCLRWNDFETNISASFRELRESSELFDVTLCCDNGSDTLQAHKLVLASCSPLFRRILGHNSHKNPFLYLKGIHLKELKAVLNFMYHGEVNVAQESLNKFLAVAEELAVKGLTTNDNVDSRISSYYDQADDEDIPLPVKRSVKKSVKRQSLAAAITQSGMKRKVDVEGSVPSLEVDLKRIKADPDESGEGQDDNGELFETGDYESIGQFDDDAADFDDSLPGGSGAGASGADNKEMEEASFLRSQKGQPILMDKEGYIYCANRKTDTRIYWKCQSAKKKGCKGRAMTEGFFITKKSGDHTHQPYPGYSANDKEQINWPQPQ